MGMGQQVSTLEMGKKEEGRRTKMRTVDRKAEEIERRRLQLKRGKL